MRITALLMVVLALVHLPTALAHSFMVEPDAYNRVFRTSSCVGSECTQACPSEFNSNMNNARDRPAAVWRRGQRVTVKWAKNNHRGGLVRMSLVPADAMMSRPWHSKLALWHGCWESGEFSCSGSDCGSDTDRKAYRRDGVLIPSVFPDGQYVVGILWVGGLHYSLKRGMFPDYYSCSHVTIKGGLPLGGVYQPFWEAGDTGPHKNGDLCRTAADAAGQCPVKTECMLPRMPDTIAKEYKNGRKPERIIPRVVAEAFNNKPDLSGVPSSGGDDDRTGGAPPPTTLPPTTQATTMASTMLPDSTMPKSTTTTATVVDSTITQSPSTTEIRRGRVCTGRVCCPRRCGKCGGSGCSKRPGGGENCCFSRVVASGRVCGVDSPPCVDKR